MGLFKSNKKYPKSRLMIVNPKNYSHSKLDRSSRKLAVNKIIKKQKSFENGDIFQINDFNGKFEVLKIDPSPSIPAKDTKIKFRNRIVYQEGFDSFDIKDDRLIEISESPELNDLKHVAKPKDFANLVDRSSSLVEYYESDNIYILENYYHKFPEK